MKRISVSLVFILFVGFVSCQKDLPDELPVDADIADTLLAGILIGDTVNPGRDLTLWEFIYDDDKRVTEIRNTYFDSANGNLDIHEQYSTYFYYNGSDRKPFKSYGWTRYIYQDWEIFHFYDGQGRLILDSLGAPDQSHLLVRFDNTAGKIVLTHSFYDENATMTDQYKDSFYVAGNNISNGFITYPMTQGQENVFAFSYDDKINPLSKLNIAATLGVEGLTSFDKFISLSPGYSRNNIIKRVGTSTYEPATNISKEYLFTYNSNNLPVASSFKENGNGDEGIRIYFKYTH